MSWHHLLHDASFWCAVAAVGTLLLVMILGAVSASGSNGGSSYSSAVARQNAEAQRTFTGISQAYDKLDADMRRVARDRRPHG
jgi:hypothetical protein